MVLAARILVSMRFTLTVLFWIIGRVGADEVAVAHILITLILFLILTLILIPHPHPDGRLHDLLRASFELFTFHFSPFSVICHDYARTSTENNTKIRDDSYITHIYGTE